MFVDTLQFSQCIVLGRGMPMDASSMCVQLAVEAVDPSSGL